MKSRQWASGILVLGIATVGYVAGRAHAAGIPATQTMTYSGVLTDTNGTPLAGSKSILLQVWDQATDGVVQCTGSPTTVTLAAGGFQLPLPDSCVAAVHSSNDLWLEVFVDGMSMGRFKLGAVPYALEAARASAATGALQTTIGALQTSVTSLGTDAVKVTGDQSIAGHKTFTGTVTISCPTGMADTGAGFCIDTADRPETDYGSSITTCGNEGKVVCSFREFCAAKVRNVGNVGAANYRFSDLMLYLGDPANQYYYLGGGSGANGLIMPAACAGLAAPGPNSFPTAFRCCRGKG